MNDKVLEEYMDGLPKEYEYVIRPLIFLFVFTLLVIVAMIIWSLN